MIYAQYSRLAVHVGASNRAVVRKAHKMIAKENRRSREMRAQRHAWLRLILKEHADARALFVQWRF